jgi:hypothetical protein
MVCEERTRLEHLVAERQAAYEAARLAVESKIGVTPREEFLSLTYGMDQALAALQRAQDLLDQHVEEHGCERSNGIAAGLHETE